MVYLRKKLEKMLNEIFNEAFFSEWQHCINVQGERVSSELDDGPICREGGCVKAAMLLWGFAAVPLVCPKCPTSRPGLGVGG